MSVIDFMERITLRIPKQQRDELDSRVESGEFPNRSEAIRAAIRDMLNGKTRDGRKERPWAKI